MKALLVATVQCHICQFHKGNVEVLHELGYQVDVAAHDNLAVKNGLKLDFADRVFDVPFSRLPFNLNNIRAYKILKHIIDTGNYDLIVCNTPVGGVLTRLAARKARRNGSCVIYMAHGFHFYKGAPMLNWLLYYPIEKYLSCQADTIVTINEEDYKIAKSRFNGEIVKIHGIGASNERYYPIPEKEKKKEKEAMGYNQYKLILCTGEFNRNKNQTCIIKAMPRIVNVVPNAKLLIAGDGKKEVMLKSLVAKLGMEEYIEFIGYRTDLHRFARISDLVVSCSHREGLPLNILEAMLCKIPIVASDNRGHRELVRDGENGYLVNSSDSSTLADRVVRLFSDKELSRKMGETGYRLAQIYTIPHVKEELKALYK